MDKNTDGRMQIFELPLSKESGKYPDKPVKMTMATVAYSAERELDTMLYNGDAGIFRNFQFPNSQAITLKTTFEEIGILWKHESKFRTGFAVNGNLVSVPNIFAKISSPTNKFNNTVQMAHCICIGYANFFYRKLFFNNARPVILYASLYLVNKLLRKPVF